MNIHKGSILVVDDNPENLLILDEFLKQLGYEVRVATNGEIALESVDALQPDIILMDIHMPKLDGYQACKILKSNPATKDIPVIFISAMNEPYNKKIGFEVGGVDYISKPFSLDELKARVAVHMELSRRIKELEIFNKAMLEREMRIIELKKEVNALLNENGSQIRYPEVQ